MMTLLQLKTIMPLARKRADLFHAPLKAAMAEWGVNNHNRAASFLSQVGHESGQLLYVREIASGIKYEGRLDLGNTEPGDGVKFRGRGLIQCTGRANYAAAGKALKLDLLNHPELLEETENACRVSGWFWQTHGLNELADTRNQVRVTRRVNGGKNGLADRLALFYVADKVLP